LSTLSSKILIKDCGKIIGEKNESDMNDVSNLIPKTFGQVMDLEESYEEVSNFKKWCDDNQEIYSIALKLRNLIRNKGVHASGMLLSHDLMDEACPTELSSDKESVSGYDMNWASLFNVKVDLLGLRSVTIVHDICSNVGITMDDIDTNDSSIYQHLQDLKTPHGLFQLEAHTNYQVCKNVKPRNLEQLSGVLALARPGALQFAEQYSRYVNEDEYEAIHPFFDDILSTTGGVALYQEQLMQMAHKIGFTLDEAEILRRIVGKKKVSEVRKWKKKIKDKIKEKNHDSQIGKILWDVLEDSANYSFNKSHSIAYAALAAMTIYLKFKYPQQFFLSLLKMTRFEPDPISEISKIHQELRFFGIKLLPPHITKSELDFSIQGKDIRFGLLSIKGISDKSIEKLEKFKNKYSSKFEVFQAAKDAKLPIGIVSSLIQAGAFQGFKQTRSRVVLEAQLWNILTPKEKALIMPMSEKHDHDLIDIIKKLTKTKDIDSKKGNFLIKESRFTTIKRDYEPYLKIYLQNKKSERFANWYYERKLLGYTYDVTLKEIFHEKQPDLLDVGEVKETATDFNIVFIGYVKEAFVGKSKKGNKYMRLTVGDELADETVLMFEHNLKGCEKVNDGLPQKDNVVIVNGVKKEDATFANTIGIQDQKVFTKLSELKNLK
jgi:DNA polymerase III alpha subunit